MAMYVVVVEQPLANWPVCFVDSNRAVAIRRAAEATRSWPGCPRMLVGELTDEVRTPIQYELVPLSPRTKEEE